MYFATCGTFKITGREFSVCVILYQFVQREIPWELCLAEAAVGGSFLIVSNVTQGNFGYGESLLILLLGVGVGFWNLKS